jgi:hypothetical protein
MKSNELKGKRWQTVFGEFVKLFRVKKLSIELGRKGFTVTPHKIYAWIYGDSQPDLQEAKAILDISKKTLLKLTLDDITNHRKTVAA